MCKNNYMLSQDDAGRRILELVESVSQEELDSYSAPTMAPISHRSSIHRESFLEKAYENKETRERQVSISEVNIK